MSVLVNRNIEKYFRSLGGKDTEEKSNSVTLVKNMIS